MRKYRRVQRGSAPADLHVDESLSTLPQPTKTELYSINYISSTIFN